MKKIKIVIERTKNHFSAYASNVDGIYAGGATVDEAKQSVEEAIKLLKKYNKKVPSILNEDYELVFKYDTASFLNQYKGVLSNASLERLTGINQRQLQHYASGLKKPRATQSKKIEKAVHRLGKELLEVEL